MTLDIIKLYFVCTLPDSVVVDVIVVVVVVVVFVVVVVEEKMPFHFKLIGFLALFRFDGGFLNFGREKSNFIK